MSLFGPTLWPHGLQHARLPCLSLSPRVGSNSCPLNQWCHPTISSSAVPFSSCLQSFPASGSFQMSHFFTLGGQNIGSFSFSIRPSNEYSGLISFRIDWLDLLAVQGTLKSLVQHQFPGLALTHVYRIGDAIQPSHPLSSPSLPVFKLFQHQGLFQGVSSSHQVAKILEFQLQH